MTRLGYRSGIIGFGRADDCCSASLLGELKVGVVRKPISRYRSSGTSTCIAYRTPDFLFVQLQHWGFKCWKLLVPLLQYLNVFLYFSLFPSSLLRRCFTGFDSAHFMFTLPQCSPRFTHKNQIPASKRSVFPQGIGPGDYEEKELEEGCGEMQLCWSPLLGHEVQGCSCRGGFYGCFWWLASMGVKGGSERRFEVAGTLRVPDDMPQLGGTRYLQKALAQLPLLLIASRMRLIRCCCR
jgi:hypothetical protein